MIFLHECRLLVSVNTKEITWIKETKYQINVKQLGKQISTHARNGRILSLDNQLSDYLYYETVPIQIYWKFYHQKHENFQMKNFDTLSTHDLSFEQK